MPGQIVNRGPWWATFAAAVTLVCACSTQHEVKTESKVKFEPINITVDVNIRVDKQLDDFFDFQDEPAPGGAAQPQK